MSPKCDGFSTPKHPKWVHNKHRNSDFNAVLLGGIAIIRSAFFVFSALLILTPFRAQAAISEVTVNDDLRAAIADLQPGDELLLNAGTYVMSSRFNIVVVGDASRPIVIRAKDGADVLISMNTGNQNILEVMDSRHLELRNLRFTGGSHGIRLMNSDFITIEGCEIFETGDVAISANSGGTYEGLVIRSNHIHNTNDTGEGMYLGCNNDACRVQNSLIEFNYIHHTNGPTVVQGDGIELKEGSSGNIIRHNVIHDTHYPGILTYSTRGNGPPNIIEGNLIWNTEDYAIQSAADSIIRNNIILSSGIGLQPHQAGSPSNQQVVHNTIIVNGNGIEVRGVSGPVLIANNAVYSQSGTAIRLISGNTSLVTLAGNIGAGGLSGGSGGYLNGNGIGSDFINGHFGGNPPIDLFPANGSALIGAGSIQSVTQYDFNESARQGAVDAGAYFYQAGGNPGWTLSPAFKVLVDNIVIPKPPVNLNTN